MFFGIKIAIVFLCFKVLISLYIKSCLLTADKSLIGKIMVAGVIIAVVAITAVIVFSMQQGSGGANVAAAPNVKFVSFDADRKGIKVGEATNMFYNVQNFEERAIEDARVTIMIEPSGFEPYLSISNQTVDLPQLLGKDAATGEIKVSITAKSTPAKEAVYVVKGVLLVEGIQTDTKQFELKISQ